MRTTMKISQSAWDSMWENSEGTQTVMFDPETGGSPVPPIPTKSEEIALQSLVNLMNSFGIVPPSYFYTPSTK